MGVLEVGVEVGGVNWVKVILVGVEQKVVVFVDERLGMLMRVLRVTISYGGPRVDDKGIDGFGRGDILGCLVGGCARVGS